jgi:electron transfer flavoprotein alpha/beta subunit
LNIVVGTKPVPDTAATLKVDEQSNVSWGDAPLVINPLDEYGIEEGIRLKHRSPAKSIIPGDMWHGPSHPQVRS